MNTEELIQSLSQSVKPVPRRSLERRIALGIALGGLVAAVIVVAVLGIRPDLHDAMHGFSFWMKWIYTASLGAGAVSLVIQLARPTGTSLRSLWILAIPVLLLTGIGVGELASTPSQKWVAMWLGGSWRVCPWLVLTLSMPIFIGLLWSFRRLAPTRLRAAGATAGLAAGAWAATIYCLHCPEVSAIFVLTWYSLGIMFAAGLGALVGPRFLRW
ncbi:DUF1109 domain-containing protein [Sphingobium yanoikuyae]|jgi:hypothetical protein|uniref:DUF1109 domain-containing protein n=1 Tax=Sphingobium yanoikuyae TaxID=13690 RepID=A0A430BN78_SPHYA|nr:DUF1109 domain-containing protein [Sphingobium yanoikuyae]RSU54154.1 DUF1109 domain-containing protein [Sphingobium yanoikuyae]